MWRYVSLLWSYCGSGLRAVPFLDGGSLALMMLTAAGSSGQRYGGHARGAREIPLQQGDPGVEANLIRHPAPCTFRRGFGARDGLLGLCAPAVHVFDCETHRSPS